MPEPLTVVDGMFGVIRVVDEGPSRLLLIGRQVQGGSLLSPPAMSVNVDLRGPGPISSAAYQTGWIMAGVQYPDGELLMVGLGSGSGAAQLLWACPGITLTVLEIDPKIISVAEEFFPLLRYYQDRGRLRIINDDAEQYLKYCAHEWDAGLADAYHGRDNNCETDFLLSLSDRCADVYLNVIDRADGPMLTQVEDVFAAIDKPIVIRVGGSARAVSQAWQTTNTAPQNWILATNLPSMPALLNWQPSESDTVAGRVIRDRWRIFVSNAVGL